MKLVVGLGNPGPKYLRTRHNVGFVVVAKVAAVVAAGRPRVRFQGEFAEGSWGGQGVGLLCPQTYMNASGRSVRKAVDFYKLDPGDVLVVCDDLNLATGKIRLRPSGSAGGQKGLADIIRHLDSDSVPRLRVGIGRPPSGWDPADYVLGKFSADEELEMERVTSRAAEACLMWATEGVGQAMNRFNGDPNGASG